MESILLLLGCIFFVFCLFLICIRVSISIVKSLYGIAPLIVFVAILAGIIYFSNIFVEEEGTNANYIESIENQSRYSSNGS